MLSSVDQHGSEVLMGLLFQLAKGKLCCCGDNKPLGPVVTKETASYQILVCVCGGGADR